MAQDPEVSSVQKNETDDSQNVSAFRPYSLGIVAANKKLQDPKEPKKNNHYIEVTPVEQFSFVDGEITDNKEELEEGAPDYNDEQWKVKVTTTPSIMARWLPIGNTNRLTAPDVRRGEPVMIWRFGDADEFWWTDMLTDDKGERITRRLETIIWAISNNAKENVADTPDSTYWIEWSTHRQVLHIHTSKSNGEPFEYDIQLNTKDGRLVIKDDVGNYIFLDSEARQIKAHNRDKSFIDINKKNIRLECLDTITNKCKHFIVEASNTIKMTTQDFSIKTNTWKLDSSSSYKVTTPLAEYSNNFKIGGSNSIGGNNRVGGVCTDSRGGHK